MRTILGTLSPGALRASKFVLDECVWSAGACWNGLLPQFVEDPPRGTPLITKPRCGGESEFAERGCPGPIPSPRQMDPALIPPDGKDQGYYMAAFLEAFGASIRKGAFFTDVTGEQLYVGSELFIDKKKTAKAGRPVYKFDKGQRRLYALVLAETLMHPQEIWEQWEWIGANEWMGARAAMALRRRYLAWWDNGDRDAPHLSVFEWAPKRWWTGVTTFVGDEREGGPLDAYIDQQRSGVRRWPK